MVSVCLFIQPLCVDLREKSLEFSLHSSFFTHKRESDNSESITPTAPLSFALQHKHDARRLETSWLFAVASMHRGKFTIDSSINAEPVGESSLHSGSILLETFPCGHPNGRIPGGDLTVLVAVQYHWGTHSEESKKRMEFSSKKIHKIKKKSQARFARRKRWAPQMTDV